MSRWTVHCSTTLVSHAATSTRLAAFLRPARYWRTTFSLYSRSSHPQGIPPRAGVAEGARHRRRDMGLSAPIAASRRAVRARMEHARRRHALGPGDLEDEDEVPGRRGVREGRPGGLLHGQGNAAPPSLRQPGRRDGHVEPTSSGDLVGTIYNTRPSTHDTHLPSKRSNRERSASAPTAASDHSPLQSRINCAA